MAVTVCGRAPVLLFAAALVSQSLHCGAQPQLGGTYYGSCALWHNEGKCWGSPLQTDPSWTAGRSAISTTTPPPEYFDLGSNFIPRRIVSGYSHQCAISTNGKARCWGDPGSGCLGYGNTAYFSDASNFGDDVNLGAAFEIADGDSGYRFNCFLSTNATVKCFGENSSGQLGYGHIYDRGDSPNELGDHLSAINFGSGFVPIQIALGHKHACALSMDNYIKCWGYNGNGNLGLGHISNRGDNANEMGDFLKYVDLGRFIPIRVLVGAYHSCAVSEDNALKCWGYNAYGRLGYGDSNNRGDGASELGVNLPAVELGSDFVLNDVYLARDHTCVSSREGRVKCFGYNVYGSLGIESTDHIGDNADEMGDNLEYVDLGSGFNVSHFGVGLAYHTCAVSTEEVVKCWGRNNYGQLGAGDTTNRGDAGCQMGDALSALNLSFVTTATPTVSPTRVPSHDPTLSPSEVPTVEPTTGPTAMVCGEMMTGNYNDEMLEFEVQMPFDGHLTINVSGSDFNVSELTAINLKEDEDGDGVLVLYDAAGGMDYAFRVAAEHGTFGVLKAVTKCEAASNQPRKSSVILKTHDFVFIICGIVSAMLLCFAGALKLVFVPKNKNPRAPAPVDVTTAVPMVAKYSRLSTQKDIALPEVVQSSDSEQLYAESMEGTGTLRASNATPKDLES